MDVAAAARAVRIGRSRGRPWTVRRRDADITRGILPTDAVMRADLIHGLGCIVTAVAR